MTNARIVNSGQKDFICYNKKWKDNYESFIKKVEILIKCFIFTTLDI